jgi:PHD/YefM family antitoxin component YafN of YafNO toxin-antitoxin module
MLLHPRADGRISLDGTGETQKLIHTRYAQKRHRILGTGCMVFVGCPVEAMTMRMTGIRDFRAHLTRYVSGEEPVLLTRHGKVSGVFLPLEDLSRVPDDLRRELAAVPGTHLSRLLDAQGVSEQEIEEEFRAHRRHTAELLEALES